MSDTLHPRIRSVATAVPQYEVELDVAKDFARKQYGNVLNPRYLKMFETAGVEHRYFCVPPEWFYESHTFAERNALYVENALDLSKVAARRALDRAGARPEDVGTIIFVTTTGISTPSVGSNLIEELGMAPHVRRVPIWGLGCAAGAAGLHFAADFARFHTNELVLLVAAEFCGLTYQLEPSVASLLSSVLFGDGVAAVVLGTGGEGPEVIGGYSTTWPGTQDVMGWRVTEPGLALILDPKVPRVVRQLAAESVESGLSSVGLTRKDVAHLAVHPGGAAVLDAFEEVLKLEPGGLETSREVLRRYGNMSSATVLFILERMLASGAWREGEHGIVSALGPGFSAEHAVLRG